jgi:isopenicillin N synthase-like dioxygenase
MQDLMYEDIEKQICETGSFQVDFPLSNKEINEAAESYLYFLSLPQNIKNKFSFKMLDPKDRGSKVGYILEKRKNGWTDNKESLYYKPIFHDLFCQEIQFSKPQIQRCFEKIRDVYMAGELVMNQVLRAIDYSKSGLWDMFCKDGEFPLYKIRFLKYDNTQDGDFLAKAHYDRGSCTLAIAESGPGLRMGKNDTNLAAIFHENKKAIWFPGIRGKELFGEDFHPQWHDVIQRSDDNVNKDVARWAIVFFVSYPGNRGEISYEECHTPIYQTDLN